MRLVDLSRWMMLVFVLVADPMISAAQSVTFAQLSDPMVLRSWRAESPSDWLEAHYALNWAVREINAQIHEGKKIDFIVITGGFGLRDCDMQSTPDKLAENLRPLRAVLVSTIYVLPGKSDLPATAASSTCSYSQFVSALKQVLSPVEVRDLSSDVVTVSGIHLLGLDSASFGIDAINVVNANRQDQLQQITRLQTLARGHKSIIFESVPDLDNPALLGDGRSAAASWHVDPVVRDAWNKLATGSDVLGVFAGHVYSSTPNVYAHDYSWVLNQPDSSLAAKLWVGPPLVTSNFPDRVHLLRGFATITVSADGFVSSSTTWFPSPLGAARPADKADKLAEARVYEQARKFDKAAAAYLQGLSSKDDWVRGQSEAGFERTVQAEDQPTWRDTTVSTRLRRWWRDAAEWLLILVVVLLAIRHGLPQKLLLALRSFMGEPAIVILAPRKGNEAAPIDEFTIQLLLACEDIQTTLAPLSKWRFVNAGDYKLVAPGTDQELPALQIGGVDVKSVLQWLLSIGFLFRRRVEIQVWGSASRTRAFAIQKLGPIQELSWMTPHRGSSADVAEAARELAYNILGQELIR